VMFGNEACWSAATTQRFEHRPLTDSTRTATCIDPDKSTEWSAP
jgi:hypothetical protein